MARFFPHPGDFSLLDQIKALADHELLDFWEETQYLERFLEEEVTASPSQLEYERLIVQELQFRSSLRPLQFRQNSGYLDRRTEASRPMPK